MNSAHITAALRRVYSAPEYAIFFEVVDATGARHTRSADAVAMSLWPSMGLGVTGFEIKVSRGDWLREKKDPSKAEAIARYCDYWNIITPAGLIKVEELPDAWGLMEVSEKGSIKTIKRAVKTPAVPLDRLFVASLLRNAHKVEMSQVRAEVRQQLDDAVEREIVRRNGYRKEAEAFGEKLMKAMKASGKDKHWLDDQEVIDAVIVVAKAGIHRSYGGLFAIEKTMREAADKIGRITGDMGVPAKARR